MIETISEISKFNHRKRNEILNLRDFFGIGAEGIEKEFFSIVSSNYNNGTNK